MANVGQILRCIPCLYWDLGAHNTLSIHLKIFRITLGHSLADFAGKFINFCWFNTFIIVLSYCLVITASHSTFAILLNRRWFEASRNLPHEGCCHHTLFIICSIAVFPVIRNGKISFTVMSSFCFFSVTRLFSIGWFNGGGSMFRGNPHILFNTTFRNTFCNWRTLPGHSYWLRSDPRTSEQNAQGRLPLQTCASPAASTQFQ